MGRDAPLAKLRRVGLGAAVGFADPVRGRLVEVEQTLERVGRDHLHRGIGAHRRGLEHLHHDPPGEVRVDHIAAIGIGADRESLDLVRRQSLIALPHVGLESRLVGVELRVAEVMHVGAAAAHVVARPSESLRIEIDDIARRIGDDARGTLRSENRLIGDLLRGVHVRFDLLQLRLENGVVLLLVRVVGLLELLERLIDLLDRRDGRFDFLSH